MWKVARGTKVGVFAHWGYSYLRSMGGGIELLRQRKSKSSAP
jgi:hypothetical protein